jgi:predicted exporter
MTHDEKLLLQDQLVQFLGAVSQDKPTLLLDTLMTGTGPQLIEWMLGSKEHAARKQAETLFHLLVEFRSEMAAKEPESKPSEEPLVPRQEVG